MIPVMSQIIKTDNVAPSTSALCQPKDIRWLFGRAETQMASIEMRKAAKSVRRWAASVAMAKELDNTPPTISANMKNKHIPEAKNSFLWALKIY